MKPIKLYRLKHKPTGLYYAKGTLSEKGKVYTSPGNYCTYLGHYDDILCVPRNSKLAEKYPILSELDRTDPKKIAEHAERPWLAPSIQIKVTASDFEKEYIATVPI